MHEGRLCRRWRVRSLLSIRLEYTQYGEVPLPQPTEETCCGLSFCHAVLRHNALEESHIRAGRQQGTWFWRVLARQGGRRLSTSPIWRYSRVHMYVHTDIQHGVHTYILSTAYYVCAYVCTPVAPPASTGRRLANRSHCQKSDHQLSNSFT